MKKLLSILSIIILCWTSYSCKKESEKKPYCRITKLIFNDSREYDIKFGDNEKISAIEVMPDKLVSSYKYENGKTIITVNLNGNFQYRLIVTTNSKGFATNVLAEENQAGTIWYNQAYTYEGNRVVNNKLTDNGGNSDDVNYIWEDGNISTIVEENDIYEYEYYADKKFQLGDWRDIQQLLSGYKLYETKNLLQSYEYNGKTTVYTYQFDDEGKIVQAKSTNSNNTSTFKLEYDCK
jgi:endo-1,4-beta-mannosidase